MLSDAVEVHEPDPIRGDDRLSTPSSGWSYCSKTTPQGRELGHRLVEVMASGMSSQVVNTVRPASCEKSSMTQPEATPLRKSDRGHG